MPELLQVFPSGCGGFTSASNAEGRTHRGGQERQTLVVTCAVPESRATQKLAPSGRTRGFTSGWPTIQELGCHCGLDAVP